ncbi:MAG: right-handed parallel beta-helix repeat-containing protein [Candidatus Hodarchaeales archaeon]|jgi:parallel beta-helix repeat protein
MKKWIKSIGLSILFLLVLTYFRSSILAEQECKPTQLLFQETDIPRIIHSDDYIEHSSIIITNNDGFKTLNIPGNGTLGNPYLIDGYIFNNTDQSKLIEIIDTDVHFSITNNLLIRPLGNFSGISLRNVTHAIISGNKIINTSIYTYQSRNNTIKNNWITGDGIPYFSKGIHISDSGDTHIINNTVENHDVGIQLWGESNNSIFSNTISNSNYSAITIYYSSYNTFINNCIGYNGLDGMQFEWADNNTIKNNLIFYNDRYGVYFGDETGNNTIKSNDFISGYLRVNNFPSFDNGTNNLFRSNYYIDWDGYGDYITQGFAGSKDTSPLLHPYHLTSPVITSPTGEILKDTVTIQWIQSVDSFDHSLSYSVFYSEDLGTTWIELNSGLTVLTTTWDVSSITNGTVIRLKVQVMDSAGYQSYSISDTSFIIESPVPTTTSLPITSSTQQDTSSSSITTTTTQAASPFLGIISILMIVCILGLFHRHIKRYE